MFVARSPQEADKREFILLKDSCEFKIYYMLCASDFKIISSALEVARDRGLNNLAFKEREDIDTYINGNTYNTIS